MVVGFMSRNSMLTEDRYAVICTCSVPALHLLRLMANLCVMTKCTWCTSLLVFSFSDTALEIQQHMLLSIIQLLLDLIWLPLTYQADPNCLPFLKKRCDINSGFCNLCINITSLVKIPFIMSFERFEARVK